MRPQDVEFINWLENREKWYERESDRWGRWRGICNVLSFAGWVLSFAVATLNTQVLLPSYVKWLLVLATLLVGITTNALVHFKIREMEELREYGELEIDEMVALARQRFAEFENDPEKLSKLQDDLRNRIAKIERYQHRQHVAIDRSHERDLLQNKVPEG
jgi:hypothetical protein